MCLPVKREFLLPTVAKCLLIGCFYNYFYTTFSSIILLSHVCLSCHLKCTYFIKTQLLPLFVATQRLTAPSTSSSQSHPETTSWLFSLCTLLSSAQLICSTLKYLTLTNHGSGLLCHRDWCHSLLLNIADVKQVPGICIDEICQIMLTISFKCFKMFLTLHVVLKSKLGDLFRHLACCSK